MSEAEFREIVMQYQDRVYNTCLGFLGNREDALDISQEVFMEVFNAYHTFLGKAKLGTWIYRIAVNKCLEAIRKDKSVKRARNGHSFGESEMVTFDHPGVKLENKELASVLFDAISKLPENQRTAFTLHKIEGVPYDEIGQIMNKSLSSVESLIHRAKARLRELLAKYYHEEIRTH